MTTFLTAHDTSACPASCPPCQSDRQEPRPTGGSGPSPSLPKGAAVAARGTERLGWRRELFAAGLALAGAVAGAGLLLGATAGGIWMQRALTPPTDPPFSVLARPAGPALDGSAYLRGRQLFSGTCALCHGPAGHGVQGLGKDVTRSEFVASLTDGGLVAFIRRGRDANDPYNTTKVPMPPSGGNPQFTDQDLASIVVFLRGLQDPRRVPADALAAPVVAAAPQPVAPPTADEKAAALAAAGGDPELAEFIASGSKLFANSCASCHGKDGRGMPKLGKNLVESDFCRSRDDDALLAFLKRGRDPSDPLNTTKVAMPPKGGNPALTDDDLLDVIAYLRSLQGGARPPAQKPAT